MVSPASSSIPGGFESIERSTVRGSIFIVVVPEAGSALRDPRRGVTREDHRPAVHTDDRVGRAVLHAALDAEAARLRDAVPSADEAGARVLVERMALALQASILLRANAAIAPMFCESRLNAAHGLAFGTLPVDDALYALILARAL